MSEETMTAYPETTNRYELEGYQIERLREGWCVRDGTDCLVGVDTLFDHSMALGEWNWREWTPFSTAEIAVSHARGWLEHIAWVNERREQIATLLAHLPVDVSVQEECDHHFVVCGTDDLGAAREAMKLLDPGEFMVCGADEACYAQADHAPDRWSWDVL